MAAKKKGKHGSGGKKDTTKVLNKQNNKVLKQSKLKKQQLLRLRKQRKGLRELAAREHGVPETTVVRREVDSHSDENLDEEDYNYFMHEGRDLSFAQLPKNLTKLQTKQEQDEKESSHYENVPRHLLSDKKNNMKMLLPIKGQQGKLITRMVEEAAEEAVEDEKQTSGVADGEDAEEEEKPLRPLSTVEIFVERKKKLEDRKKNIALLATSILENPQEHVRRLGDLRQMLNEKEPDLYITIRKLVIVSLMEVFKDIVPGYRIRLLTDKEKAQQLKKETKSLHEFESSLLLNYKQYLEHLELAIKGKAPKSKKGPVMEIPKSVSQNVAELACTCMCEMLVHHPHFNYTSNIISVLVPLMVRRTCVSDKVIKAVIQVFNSDKTGDITLEIVRSVGRMIKASNFHVKPKILETFLSLKIKEVDLSTSGENRKVEKRKEQLKKLSRKEKKRKKAMDKINLELQEVQATEDKKKKLKLHTEIIQAVFVTYFRILKNAPQSVLLPTVLEGLAKFAHLINVEFFDDLFRVFQELLSSNNLTHRESLHCVQTAFTILSGQGSVLNIDPMTFYKHFYTTLFKIHAGRSSEDLPIILSCLDLMIHRRRKQVSHQRLLSYVKRLCTLMLQQSPHASLSLLSALRGLIQVFPYTDRLFDNEAEGSGMFRPEIEDPEHSNAHNTALWELALLQHHFHPTVRQYSSHISRQAPSSGVGQLPHHLSRLSALEMYKKFNLSTPIFDSSLPDKLQGKKKKTTSKSFHDPDFADYLQKYSSSPSEEMMDTG